MYRTLALIIWLLLAPAAHAATSPWQDIAPGAKLRLISSDVVDAGEMLIALEVRLAPGIKTYWRVPGETGIPLQLDFSASTGISQSQILWPMPMREQVAGFTDHVYYGEISFPIRLVLSGQNPMIDVNLIMGVCSDICVPVSSRLTLKPEPGTRDVASDISIRQALNTVPIAWTGEVPLFNRAAYDQSTNSLVLTGVDEELDLGTLIASIKDASIVFAAPQKSPKRGVVSFERLGWGDLSDLTGQTVSLIFQTDSGPFQVEQTLVGIDQLDGND